MYIHIDKNGKIDDVCSRLDGGHKRDEAFFNGDYIEVESKGMLIGDTWNFENNTSFKDSSQRFVESEPTELELLQEKYNNLESRLKILEEK